MSRRGAGRIGMVLLAAAALAAGWIELRPRTAERPRIPAASAPAPDAFAGSAAVPATPARTESAAAPADSDGQLSELRRQSLARAAAALPSDLGRGFAVRRSPGGPAPLRELRETPSPTRLALLEAANLLAAAGEPFELGGFEHEPSQVVKHGLPIFNRRGRLRRQDGELRGVAGAVSFPPIRRRDFALGRDQAVTRALERVGAGALRAAPTAERGWYAARGQTLPAWRVDFSTRQPAASWRITLDAGTGEVLSQVDRLLSVDGTGSVYDPNVREAKALSQVPLRDLDGTGLLSGTYVRVFDDRDVEAFSPGLDFDFPTDDPRFVQTAAYRGLTDAGRLAVAHGFPAFAQPLLAFTNLGSGGGEFNNAFYDPNLQTFGFGNGDGVVLANLGTDLDVAAHEMGHHIFEQLVTPEIETFSDPVLAMHEGIADTFSVLIGGDLDIGESTRPGKKFLRTLKGSARFPNAYDPDPHVTGRVYGAANADMRKKLGEDFLPTFFAALPLLPPDAVEEDYRQAFFDADAASNGGLHRDTLEKIFKKRGFDNLVPKDFQGVLTPGVPANGALQEGRLHLYTFFEFPGSTRVRFFTTGTGNVDLFAAPLEIYDPEIEGTFRFSEGASSSESITFNAGSTPSVHAGDNWLVAVLDRDGDDQDSTYTLNLEETLPSAQILVDGPSVGGEILFSSEVDYFLFEGSQGDIVRLEVHDVNGTLDPLAAILTVEDFELVAIDDDSGPGLDVLIQGAELPTHGPFAVAVLSPLADLDPTVGTGPYTVTLSTCNNTGTDTDNDGFADVCDDDDDDDGFLDDADTDPVDPDLCADVDDDGCDDCVSGVFDNLNDGPDVEGDGLCDPGDPDDDNDGCPDLTDPAPLVTSVDDDFDFLGSDCDNCLEVPNPGQLDSNGDDRGDACSSCTRVAWTQPPALPPDQNPAASQIELKKLDKEGAPSFKASGVFGLPFAGPIDPAASGVFLRLADSDGPLVELNIPPGAPGSSPCGPKDGWTTKVKGEVSTFTYGNKSDGLPADACAPGSAGGQPKLQIVSSPTEIRYKLAFKALALEGDPAQPVSFLQLDLVLDQQTQTGVGSTGGDAGLCAQSVLRIGDPAAHCKVSEKSGVLKSISCKAD